MRGCLFLCKGHLDLVLVRHFEAIELLFRDARLEVQAGDDMLSDTRDPRQQFRNHDQIKNKWYFTPLTCDSSSYSTKARPGRDGTMRTSLNPSNWLKRDWGAGKKRTVVRRDVTQRGEASACSAQQERRYVGNPPRWPPSTQTAVGFPRTESRLALLQAGVPPLQGGTLGSPR